MSENNGRKFQAWIDPATGDVAKSDTLIGKDGCIGKCYECRRHWENTYPTVDFALCGGKRTEDGAECRFFWQMEPKN